MAGNLGYGDDLLRRACREWTVVVIAQKYQRPQLDNSGSWRRCRWNFARARDGERSHCIALESKTESSYPSDCPSPHAVYHYLFYLRIDKVLLDAALSKYIPTRLPRSPSKGTQEALSASQACIGGRDESILRKWDELQQAHVKEAEEATEEQPCFQGWIFEGNKIARLILKLVAELRYEKLYETLTKEKRNLIDTLVRRLEVEGYWQLRLILGEHVTKSRSRRRCFGT